MNRFVVIRLGVVSGSMIEWMMCMWEVLLIWVVLMSLFGIVLKKFFSIYMYSGSVNVVNDSMSVV